MSGHCSITEWQVLWLRELGIDQLWGKTLKASVPCPVREVEDVSSHRLLPLMSTDIESELIKGATPEVGITSGRLPQDKHPVLGKLREQLVQAGRKSTVTKREKIRVSSSTWQALQKEVTAYYQQWSWIHHDDEVFIGEQGKLSGLMIIEEMPSADDCMQKQAFSGDVGVLLGNILNVLSLHREEVSLTSVLKFHCRNEIGAFQYEQCLPFLQAQIQWLNPKCIWLLGARAAQPVLTPNTMHMEYLRAKEWAFPVTEEATIPVVVSQHPSLLLVDNRLKKEVWDDLHNIAYYLAK